MRALKGFPPPQPRSDAIHYLLTKNALPYVIAWIARDDNSEIYERSFDCIL
jgi:hypothetical protein